MTLTATLTALLEKATPGPWRDRIGIGGCDYIVKAERSSDAELIAAMRDALPLLLRVVAAAEAWRDKRYAEDGTPPHEELAAAIDALRTDDGKP